MSKAVAVISGDIHYNLNNLSLADAATRMAIAKANELNVPFIANGDTHDTKSNLRGECVNAMIETFKTAKIKPYVNIGNHCKISAKGLEHSLNFLAPYAHIIDQPTFVDSLSLYIIPYFDDVSELRLVLKSLRKNSTLVMHQGLSTGLPGEYIVDHSALDTEDLKDFRTILSHYHARQDIVCGRPRQGAIGLASYVGSPYTTSFAEAKDPAKGFQILMDDNLLEFVPTNLRKHVSLCIEVDDSGLFDGQGAETIQPEDLVKATVYGRSDLLAKLNKEKVAQAFRIEQSFRLDLIPTEKVTVSEEPRKELSQPALLNHLIDNVENTDHNRKTRLKDLWQNLIKG